MLYDKENVDQNTLDLIKWECSIMIKDIKRGDIDILYIYSLKNQEILDHSCGSQQIRLKKYTFMIIINYNKRFS